MREQACTPTATSLFGLGGRNSSSSSSSNSDLYSLPAPRSAAAEPSMVQPPQRPMPTAAPLQAPPPPPALHMEPTRMVRTEDVYLLFQHLMHRFPDWISINYHLTDNLFRVRDSRRAPGNQDVRLVFENWRLWAVEGPADFLGMEHMRNLQDCPFHLVPERLSRTWQDYV